MTQDKDKPLYWEYHEGFRRLLIVGSVCFVIGAFLGDRAMSDSFMPWFAGWYPTFMWVSGLIILGFCFVMHPRQYSIYPDCLVVQAWYPRRKVVPFDEITELKAWTNVGRRHIIVISEGENYSFGWTLLAPRKIELFADRLEEAMNRRRFYAGLDPIEIQPEKRKEKKRKKKKDQD